MSYESIEESAFRKLMDEIKCLRMEVAELKEILPVRCENVSSDHKVYNNRHVCELLNVSKGTLEKYRNEGLITYTKRGRKFFYSQKDLDRFLKQTSLYPPGMEVTIDIDTQPVHLKAKGINTKAISDLYQASGRASDD